MFKKSFLVLYVLLLSAFLISFVSAANIGYIVKTSYPMNVDEVSLISLLETNGHNVSFLDDNDSINVSSYDLIIVGEDITNINGLFDNRYSKTLFLGHSAAKNAGLSQYSGTTTNNRIDITDNTHKITEEFDLGETTIYGSSNTVNYLYGCTATNSQGLANKLYDYKKIILILREDSLLLKDGSCIKREVQIFERNLFFGIPKASSWNYESKKLFLNSVNWMIEGEDNDGDGYYYYEDCDDTDFTKYQLLEAYADSDNDGYGAESLINVCSGEELPEGYSEINTDCDDSDETINPEADENQYDLIDSNCDGSAELSSEIPEIIWNEDENTSIDLNSYVWNPNNNSLEFYIYATSDDDYISIRKQENGIFNLSSQEDWSGEDWVVFLIVDNQNYLNTNEVKLIVEPVNDAPIANIIENITWNEDVNLTNYLDLNDYFYDPDENELTFSVIGNTFINILFDNGFVSFYPQKDWFGTEFIHFSGFDGQYTIDSNEVTLTVNDLNEPPEFGVIDCQIEINEDEEYSCELTATDIESDSFTFSATNENNINCDIDGSELTYKSDKDYNGEASCLIVVSDDFSSSEYSLEVNILPINDAPVITDYYPKGVIKLMENTNKLFSITAEDIDEDDLEITWFLDNIEVASGRNTYNFNQSKGNYNLTSSITDNLADAITKTFNVFVGDTSDFTCQEVGGYVIAENQICSAELLPVKDINNCCSIQGSPRFSEADRCTALNDGIAIEIKDPDANEELTIGDIFNIKLEIENNFEEKLSFNTKVYLYDITSDDNLDDDKDSIKISEGDTEKLEFEFEVPEDLNKDHEYAIFVSTENKDNGYCNEKYILIKIERPENEVVIENFKIDQTDLICGDYLNAEVKLKNIGSSDEDVSLLIENTELGIREITEEFELERYDDKDTITKFFSIKIPEDTVSGKHNIKLSAFFDAGNEKKTLSKEISVDCKQIEQEITEVQELSLTNNNENIQTNTSTSKTPVLVLSIIISVVLLAVIIFLFIKSSKGGLE